MKNDSTMERAGLSMKEKELIRLAADYMALSLYGPFKGGSGKIAGTAEGAKVGPEHRELPECCCKPHERTQGGLTAALF